MVDSYHFFFNVTASVDLSEEVVAFLMASFISPNRQNEVSHRCGVVESVVINSILSGSSVLPVSQRSSFSVDVVKNHGVVFEGSFLQVSVELVAESWADEVCDEEGCSEGGLLEEDENSHQYSRLVQSQKGKEVESFII